MTRDTAASVEGPIRPYMGITTSKITFELASPYSGDPDCNYPPLFFNSTCFYVRETITHQHVLYFRLCESGAREGVRVAARTRPRALQVHMTSGIVSLQARFRALRLRAGADFMQRHAKLSPPSTIGSLNIF